MQFVDIYGCNILNKFTILTVLQLFLWAHLYYILGELLLSDDGKLTVPAGKLIVVNHAFETVLHNEEDFETSFEATPANSAKIPHLHNVQIVYDFVQKLRRLKVN